MDPADLNLVKDRPIQLDPYCKVLDFEANEAIHLLPWEIFWDGDSASGEDWVTDDEFSEDEWPELGPSQDTLFEGSRLAIRRTPFRTPPLVSSPPVPALESRMTSRRMI